METKGKVDVLQVMDDLIYGGFKAPLARENGTADAARAAVAELIESAEHAIQYGTPAMENLNPLRAALSALRSSQGGREGDEVEAK